jgi:glycosyltransferase involved in cell wall biosynthesis
MRLLVVVNSLEVGGAERLIADQLRLGRDRWDAAVACLDSLGPLGEELRALGIPVTVLGACCRLDVRAVFRLRRLMRDWRPDVVHLHLPRSAVIGRLAGLGLPHRLVATEHNTWDMYRWESRYLNAATIRLTDGVAAVSRAVADSIRARLGPRALNGRLVVIPNGVDVETIRKTALPRAEARRQLGLGQSGLVVGNVANLFPRKGHSFLLEAAAVVARDVPEARFVIIGTGDQDEALRLAAERAGLADRVVFAGRRREAYRLMPAFDVFALPSLFEGMPIALLEAMSLAVPAVATRVGGVPEVVRDGRTGLLVPPGDAPALAAALTRLLKDSGLRAAFAEEARQTVQACYSMDAYVAAYDRLYRNLPHQDGTTA